MAISKTMTILLLFFIFSCGLTSSSSSVPNGPPRLGGVPYRPPLIGGWQPIENVNDPKIQELAKFALTEQKWLGGARLQFGRVIEGEEQVVAGKNYKLILTASSGGNPGIYEAILHERRWENILQLKSFRAL